MKGSILAGIVLVILWADFTRCQDTGIDRTGDEIVGNIQTRHHQRPKFHAAETEDEFDIGNGRNTSVAENAITQRGEKQVARDKHGIKHSHQNRKQKHYNHDGGEPKSKKARKRKVVKERQEEQEQKWYHCSDGSDPINVKDVLTTEQPQLGHMCRDLYPESTCCYNHDLTMELVGDKILEQIPELQCAKMLMKLRCAHCSPRSWWLFHAPDKVRHPHKRMLPIMCPSFCRKFHRLCRDSVAGLQDDSFCDYHTTNEEGPCFPDSFVRRGTID